MMKLSKKQEIFIDRKAFIKADGITHDPNVKEVITSYLSAIFTQYPGLATVLCQLASQDINRC